MLPWEYKRLMMMKSPKNKITKMLGIGSNIPEILKSEKKCLIDTGNKKLTYPTIPMLKRIFAK